MGGAGLGAIALMGGGLLFLWSSLHGASLTGSLRDLLAGRRPSGADTAPIGGGPPSPAGSGGGPLSGAYSRADLERLWAANGGAASTASVAAAVALAESSGRAAAVSANPDGGVNVGLWQLDTNGKGAGFTVAQLSNPDTNARLTVMGSANGTDWSAWATYASGAYRAYLGSS